MYGKELILDLHNCDPSLFNRKDITRYFEELCELIDMERCDLHFWISEESEEKDPRTFGTSAIQFIITSNITIHTLPLLRKVFLNIFSCKDFDAVAAKNFSIDFFSGIAIGIAVVPRL